MLPERVGTLRPPRVLVYWAAGISGQHATCFPITWAFCPCSVSRACDLTTFFNQIDRTENRGRPFSSNSLRIDHDIALA